jgi:hypothetical protein
MLFFFGGMPWDILGSEENDSEEKKVIQSDEYKKTADEKRANLIKYLNINREIHDVSDLYDTDETRVGFNPIYFRVHVPSSLQIPFPYRLKSLLDMTEDFECVYDGSNLFIGNVCDLQKLPNGVLSVRDLAFNVLKSSKIDVKKVAPCIFAQPIIFSTEDLKENENGKLIFYVKVQDTKKLLRQVYSVYNAELTHFIGIAYLSNEIDKRIFEIKQKLNKLLKIMSTPPKKFLGRFRLDTTTRRNDIINILYEASDCQSEIDELSKTTRDFELFRQEYPMKNPWTKAIDLTIYGSTNANLNYDSIIKNLELIRNELDNRSRNRYTLLSASSAAIVGSLLTLLVTYLLRAIPT